jgi:hypothetical protein
MPASRHPGLDRPGPAAAPPLLSRSWPVLLAVAAVALVVAALAALSGSNGPDPAVTPARADRCDALTGPVPDAAMPAGVAAVRGQFVHQTGQVGTTAYTYTAVPNADLDAVLAQVTGALRAAGYTSTLTAAPPPGEPAGDRAAVLTVSGPGGRGTVTLTGRCASQTSVAYVLTR